MKSVSFVCPLAVALAVVGGCNVAAPRVEPVQSTSAAIQGGSTDTSDDFAVGIWVNISATEGAICSGALLAPNLVATARHCVAPPASDSVQCGSSSFPAPLAASQFSLTNGTTLKPGGNPYTVKKIVVPPSSSFCGNDLALLILNQNVQIPQYVEPVINPPMTDHKTWATTVTAIGYGVTSATDTTGSSAGTRRIKQNIGLECIPNDTTFVDCFSSPGATSALSANEFVSGDGTCEGDSGSSAYDQTQFNAGKWVSFGVLSRGGQSGSTCVQAIYTRFDAWSQLLIDTANEAAQDGGYSPPAWTGSGSSSGGSGSSSGGSNGGSSGSSSGSPTSGPSTGKSDGTSCNADTECSSQNCVSTNGSNFVCASACGSSNSCQVGMSCNAGFCFTDAPSSVSQHSGCAVAALGEPSGPLPWREAMLVALGAVGLAAARRRRSR